MRIVFIRHGETTGDVEDRYGGAFDDHLTVRGVEQSRALAEELRSFEAQAVFTSPMLRAQETAAIIAEVRGLSPEIVPDLRERDQYAGLSGMLKSQALRDHPELVELLKDRRNTIEGAETYDEFSHRVRACYEELISRFERDGTTTALVVWHGGPMRVLFRDILKWGELTEIGDCCYAVLEGDGNDWKLTQSARMTLVPEEVH